ncbi:hypothetical protein [Solidesulfovibrio sp.]|uniref:hypothetical protein n=1 Tax=Solidesulfovibrio sp. TaxID=2910990 RepID=UPI002B21D944|nr:hypothetical protein [Solidesulfovibrio sp.]MEA4855375.1 hypothetical protein [Solidesulfovibrio sp.]
MTAAVSIPKGRGGFPRILSLAAERAKSWYFHPQKCPPLQSHPSRQTRSERREACQIVLETILRHLDLASMCLGTPTLANGFIDIDMRTIVHDSGISQRRCERAIALLKQAGFMRVQQPRMRSEEGAYFGCRAIRIVTETLFEWLGLGTMLRRERARASERLRRKAQKANRKLVDFMRRVMASVRPIFKHRQDRKSREQRIALWNATWASHIRVGLDVQAAQRRTNETLGYPPGYRPGLEQ